MEQKVTDKGQKILSAIENKLGRSPSKDEMDDVCRILEKQGLTSLTQGSSSRYVFAFPNSLVTGGGVVKLPRKEDDFWGEYPLEHLGVDQNIRAIYTAEYLSDDGLAPPLIDYSEVGSWVVFPFVESLSKEDMDEFERKVDSIRSRKDINCATKREVSGVLDIEVQENWGVFDGQVVLRDLGSVVVREQDAPTLDLVADPYWESQ